MRRPTYMCAATHRCLLAFLLPLVKSLVRFIGRGVCAHIRSQQKHQQAAFIDAADAELGSVSYSCMRRLSSGAETLAALSASGRYHEVLEAKHLWMYLGILLVSPAVEA